MAMQELGRASQEENQPSANPKAGLCSAQEVSGLGQSNSVARYCRPLLRTLEFILRWVFSRRVTSLKFNLKDVSTMEKTLNRHKSESLETS